MLLVVGATITNKAVHKVGLLGVKVVLLSIIDVQERLRAIDVRVTGHCTRCNVG